MDKNTNEVIIVVLRKPYNDPNEKRSDPFWEFGSFGCTKCHYANLMSPKTAEELEGKRLAFAQGGNEGFRLVYLTPPIKVVRHYNCIEAKWSPISMPFKYINAPLLIDNQGNTDVRSIKNEIKNVNRTTWVAKFSSAFRSRKRPVSEQIASELISIYEINRRPKNSNTIATNYEEALPFNLPQKDRSRRATYLSLIKKQGRKCRI